MHARIGWQNLRTSEFLDSGDYMLITGTDFDDGTVNYSTCHFVERERYEQDKNIQIRNGSILITKDGTLGKVAYVQGLSMPATLNAGVFNVEIRNTSIVDERYLFQYLKAPFLMDYVDKKATGGTIKHLNQNILVDFPVVMPKKTEQVSIGNFFQRIDTLITLHQRKYEKLVNIKKSMLDKMFPKNGASVPEIRFKGFTDPWEQRKLGDITVELSEYATQELGLPLLTSSRSGLMYQDEYRDSRTTKSTETLFSVVPVGTCTYRHMSDDDVFHMNINTLEKGLVSREYPVFEASKGNNLEFLVQHINSSEEFKAFCAEQKKGGTRTRLYYNTLCQFTVRVPALKEQAQISQCLKKLDTLITLHQREHIKPILEVKRVK